MLFKRKPRVNANINTDAAYAVLLDRACMPRFYSAYGVPDTLEGRFDLLTLHVFLIMEHTLNTAPPSQAEIFNQKLFDAMFANMSQSLRQRGIGDMGIPKHMRRMMLGFNGRVHSYADAGDNAGALGAVLIRNVYGDTTPHCGVQPLLGYIRNVRDALKSQDIDNIMRGVIALPDAP